MLKPRHKCTIEDEDGTEAKTQFETPNAKVHGDDKSHNAQIKREDCNPEAIGASNTAPMLPTRVLRACSKGPQRPHKSQTRAPSRPLTGEDVKYQRRKYATQGRNQVTQT